MEMIQIIDDAYPIVEYIEKVIQKHNNLKLDEDSYNHLGDNVTTRKMQELKDGKLKAWFQNTAQNYMEVLGEEYGFSTEGRYAICDSLFHFHYDIGDDLKRHFDDPGSMFSMVLYLNDNDSGATYFPFQDIKVVPRKNRLVIFPSSIYGVHEAEPVTEGYKDILGCFIHIVMDKDEHQKHFKALLKEA